jgi:hypothetical protein
MKIYHASYIEDLHLITTLIADSHHPEEEPDLQQCEKLDPVQHQNEKGSGSYQNERKTWIERVTVKSRIRITVKRLNRIYVKAGSATLIVTVTT